MGPSTQINPTNVLSVMYALLIAKDTKLVRDNI